MEEDSVAFGAPGIEPRWTSSAKDGIGTAYDSSSPIWFTLSHGIVNEIYFPHVDTPNTRDLQLLITDGDSFCHEERRDLLHHVEYPEPGALLYKITNTDRDDRYQLVKYIAVAPQSSVLLIHVRLRVLDPKLLGKLRVYALLAPHIKGTGRNNSAMWCGLDGRKLFDVQREDINMSFGCTPDFIRRSIGYVGFSDGWQDLMANFAMDWQFDRATDGNIALIGEVDLSNGMEFLLGVAFGNTPHSASAHLIQAFASPFAAHRKKYVRQWRRARAKVDLSDYALDGGALMRISQCVLLAHEDKIFQGAFVASMSIPWGDTRDDVDGRGYHLVWARDMVQSATALLACGHTESPLRALIWLACVQTADGRLPQNSTVSGKAYWRGVQLDEVAMPILLAWRLKHSEALRQFDPWPLVSRAARFLILNGPVTSQDRWEENSGYSPSTIATIIAGLVCTAEFARGKEEDLAASFLMDYADWLSANIEDWMVTNCGSLVNGQPRHFIRMTPADSRDAQATPDPDRSEVALANGGGIHPARNVVSGDFLHLVRLGVRAAVDPLIVDSVAVIDEVLKRDLPQGPCWRRYNHDGYGQKADGSAYDGTGEGRSWPVLTGERAHYEIAAGRDPRPLVAAMEGFANEGGMLSEQLWDTDDLPHGKMKRGSPTGAAMPLCWSHAEYLTLLRSHRDGVCFERIEPVYERYAVGEPHGAIEMWTLAHQPARVREGKTLRIILEEAATIHWSFDGWATVSDIQMRNAGIGCWFADLPSDELDVGSRIAFTFRNERGWAGMDWYVTVEAPHSSRNTPAPRASTGAGRS